MNGTFLRITSGGMDGFFGLFVDNLLQLLLIFTLCPFVCGISAAEVTSKILPGAALSILAGNFFFAMGFVFQVFATPTPGLLPMLVIIV